MALCCLIDKWFWPVVIVLPIFFITFYAIRFVLRIRKSKNTDDKDSRKRTVAFFHPYCNAGGGGERVLWCAIQALQKKYPNVDCVVYTGDTDATDEEIVAKAKLGFGVSFERSIRFVRLTRRRFVEASMYPVFTLLGQSLGGLLLGIEAVTKFVPDIYVDSMGYAFTLPLFRYLADCRTVSYVHYPTISTDMLNLVGERRESFNNSSVVSKSWTLSRLKLIYYHFFAFLYGLVGMCSDVILVNSTWTYGHIADLWRRPERTMIVYPPCDVDELKNLSVRSEILLENEKEIRILSVGQFRPEKDHRLQLKSFEKFRHLLDDDDKLKFKTKLILVGGCRNDDDRRRVAELKKFAEQELNLSNDDDVEWKLNISFDELKEEFEKALIGIHTMWNEHFGIGIVESMAAGNIMIAHDSGGPKMDILNVWEDKEPGFLASNDEMYAEKMLRVVKMTKQERDDVRAAAKRVVDRFSSKEFDKKFLNSVDKLINS